MSAAHLGIGPAVLWEMDFSLAWGTLWSPRWERPLSLLFSCEMMPLGGHGDDLPCVLFYKQGEFPSDPGLQTGKGNKGSYCCMCSYEDQETAGHCCGGGGGIVAHKTLHQWFSEMMLSPRRQMIMSEYTLGCHSCIGRWASLLMV
jgi:hypothetical protein